MTYIALLRGINVGGRNKIKMADLRHFLSENGFENVKTYIQSGNVVLDSIYHSTKVVEKIRQIIVDNFGFDIKIVVKTPEEIIKIANDSPSEMIENIPHNRVFAMMLDAVPEKENVEIFLERDFAPDLLTINKDVVYFACPNGVSKSKLSNNLIEKKLKVNGTTRNYKTMVKLLSMVNV
ncbi:MAG: DUF1697 domain-containing protein [Saprospiraceae bacterium]